VLKIEITDGKGHKYRNLGEAIKPAVDGMIEETALRSSGPSKRSPVRSTIDGRASRAARPAVDSSTSTSTSAAAISSSQEPTRHSSEHCARERSASERYEQIQHRSSQMPERGLDNRAVNEDGRIREKNGSAKMGNLAKTYPELQAFSPEATLTGTRNRYGVTSISEVRRLAARKASGR
jgi:hypothetical protein